MRISAKNFFRLLPFGLVGIFGFACAYLILKYEVLVSGILGFTVIYFAIRLYIYPKKTEENITDELSPKSFRLLLFTFLMGFVNFLAFMKVWDVILVPILRYFLHR